MMFTAAGMYKYAFMLGIVIVVGFFGNKLKSYVEGESDEYDLIRKYLLNDSPMYGYNRPKLWIHSKYELNARKWKSFHSRSSTDLNQPYLHSAIKTIINHCGQDFNICLIDDESFSKLIPEWDINVATLAEPMRTNIRELAMIKLLYIYGGMVVPNSFICCKNLKELYELETGDGRLFIGESVNRTENMIGPSHAKKLFVPNTYFMGAKKENPILYQCMEYLRVRNLKPHYSADMEFLGDTSAWFETRIDAQTVNLVDGQLIGVKTKDRKPILLEDIMEEGFLNTVPEMVGIYIPADEVLNRTKYQWFAAISTTELLNSNLAVVKYLKASIVDTNSDYSKRNPSEIKSVLAI
jgi:hypothetical protein